MIPLYGFLQGDTIGLLVLAEEHDTMAQLVEKLQSSAAVRVPRREKLHVEVHGRRLAAQLTVAAAELAPLDRIDVREGE